MVARRGPYQRARTSGSAGNERERTGKRVFRSLLKRALPFVTGVRGVSVRSRSFTLVHAPALSEQKINHVADVLFVAQTEGGGFRERDQGPKMFG